MHLCEPESWSERLEMIQTLLKGLLACSEQRFSVFFVNMCTVSVKLLDKSVKDPTSRPDTEFTQGILDTLMSGVERAKLSHAHLVVRSLVDLLVCYQRTGSASEISKESM